MRRNKYEPPVRNWQTATTTRAQRRARLIAITCVICGLLAIVVASSTPIQHQQTPEFDRAMSQSERAENGRTETQIVEASK